MSPFMIPILLTSPGVLEKGIVVAIAALIKSGQNETNSLHNNRRLSYTDRLCLQIKLLSCLGTKMSFVTKIYLSWGNAYFFHGLTYFIFLPIILHFILTVFYQFYSCFAIRIVVHMIHATRLFFKAYVYFWSFIGGVFSTTLADIGAGNGV